MRNAMMRHRPLHETISEIADGLLEATANAPLQTRTVELKLPIDIYFPDKGEDLAGDLPLFRLRTVFDPEPSWLHIVLGDTSL